mmetsp:Transcript_26828/g.64608  ORF Transcript_26828/g.64608 Transcript_26828/m.64608 type:complete len:202 (-) Transcript_26828:290-895(-)
MPARCNAYCAARRNPSATPRIPHTRPCICASKHAGAFHPSTMPRKAAILNIPVDKSSPPRALMAATATRNKSPPTAPAASSLRPGQHSRITSSTTWAASAEFPAIPEATANSKSSLVAKRARVLTRRKTLSTKASHSTSGSNHSAHLPRSLGIPAAGRHLLTASTSARQMGSFAPAPPVRGDRNRTALCCRRRSFRWGWLG